MAVKYHFARDLIDSGEVKVTKISTAYNLDDIFTNVLLLSKVKVA